MTHPKVGELAPDFTAAGTGGRTYSLSEYRGKVVLLVFYPGDASPVCTEQLSGYSQHFSDFPLDGALTLALSPQDVASHEVFAQDHDLRFPLLYDENKEIGRQYSIIGPLGFYRRSVFVIDANGRVRYARRSTAGLKYPSAKSLATAVASAHTPFDTNESATDSL